MPDLIRSLELDDDMFNESADGAACGLLAELFRQAPAVVDDALAAQMPSQPEEIQGLYVRVYQNVTARWRRWDKNRQPADPDRDRAAITLAFRRCLQLLQDDRLGLDALGAVPRAIKSVCASHPAIALAAFDSLLGTLAVLRSRERPPEPRPRLILPGEAPVPQQLLAMEAHTRLLRWHQFQRSLRECLEELVEKRPAETLAALLTSFERLGSKTAPTFKADVLELVGYAGRQADHRPSVMPALWKGLMDYDSQVVRASAITALARAFDGAPTHPPANVVETLLVHLRDSYVVVHTAAIRALESNPDWLSGEQAVEAVNLLYGWAHTYRDKDSSQFEAVLCLMLSLSHTVPHLRQAVVRTVVGLLPASPSVTNEHLLRRLTHRIRPAEAGAETLAVQLARSIATSGQSAFDYHESRERVERFSWLYGLPTDTFAQVEPSLLELGRQAARRDPRDGCLFASLFGTFGRYAAEAEILGLADDSLPAGRQNDRFKEALAALRAAAELNRTRSPG